MLEIPYPIIVGDHLLLKIRGGVQSHTVVHGGKFIIREIDMRQIEKDLTSGSSPLQVSLMPLFKPERKVWVHGICVWSLLVPCIRLLCSTLFCTNGNTRARDPADCSQ